MYIPEKEKMNKIININKISNGNEMHTNLSKTQEKIDDVTNDKKIIFDKIKIKFKANQRL